jgi:hypothetical protein
MDFPPQGRGDFYVMRGFFLILDNDLTISKSSQENSLIHGA